VPAGQEPPPDEVLAALVASLRAELAGTRAELEQALGRIAELEARLAQTPRNSSRPPSSEGLAKPAPRPRSLRRKSGRRPGGQDGHKGTTLMQVARPDREVRHEPGCCGRCGAALAGRPVTGVERRQVFDLPPVRAEVTEHQLIERECGCGQRNRAATPPGAEGPVCYGPRVAAVIIYLYIAQFPEPGPHDLADPYRRASCCRVVPKLVGAVVAGGVAEVRWVLPPSSASDGPGW